MSYAVVIPTIGRPSLGVLLAQLAKSHHNVGPSRVVVVDDRPVGCGQALQVPDGGVLVRVLRSGGRGPAAARNVGWRAADTEWVAFLDDDVVPTPEWAAQMAQDIRGLAPDVGASQGRIEVPLPTDRRPTDVERGTAGLASARWITADMAYRRAVLQRVGGFDERFGRAYREDADLALRVIAAGYRILDGQRRTVHPVRPSAPLVSVRAQRGNADDALMRRRHGPRWRERIGDGPGRLRRHGLTTAAAAIAFGAAARRHPQVATAAGLAWIVLTAEFALHRILPGPRSAEEIGRMLISSIAIPPVACWHRLTGELRWQRVSPATPVPAAVLFDRDGTLVHDVPYNTDPAAVWPVPGAREALDRLRDIGIPVGVVTNQSGVARGLISPAQLEQVNTRVSELLGPFDVWSICRHGEDDGCPCRKPAPGLVKDAAAQLGVPVGRCVVIGDTGADITAASAAGARGILVPTARTLRQEIQAAGEVAPDIAAALDLALSGRVP
ncbi:MAG: HAD-IIIA family hydrolase [Pseudonocardiales bacterium]|nr:HAD-IIIA family hydrolase [Pseudonocardiales bacterium]